MRCGDCSNWRDTDNGQCRAHRPEVLVSKNQDQVIRSPSKNNQTSQGLTLVSFWPPVGAEQNGCGEFTPKPPDGIRARLALALAVLFDPLEPRQGRR